MSPVKVACLRMRCQECITEMHKLDAIVKAGAAEIEVSTEFHFYVAPKRAQEITFCVSLCLSMIILNSSSCL